MAWEENRARALLKAAESLRDQARGLESEVDKLRQKAAYDRTVKRWDRLGEKIAREVETGLSEAEALAQYDRQNDLASGQAEALYRIAVKRRRWLRLWRRNREINRLAWEGHSNPEIAVKIAWLNEGKALHPVTVSRILGKELRTRGNNPATRHFSRLEPLRDQI